MWSTRPFLSSWRHLPRTWRLCPLLPQLLERVEAKKGARRSIQMDTSIVLRLCPSLSPRSELARAGLADEGLRRPRLGVVPAAGAVKARARRLHCAVWQICQGSAPSATSPFLGNHLGGSPGPGCHDGALVSSNASFFDVRSSTTCYFKATDRGAGVLAWLQHDDLSCVFCCADRDRSRRSVVSASRLGNYGNVRDLSFPLPSSGSVVRNPFVPRALHVHVCNTSDAYANFDCGIGQG